MLEVKLFCKHEGKHVSSQLLVLWAINRQLMKKQGGKNKDFFYQDKY